MELAELKQIWQQYSESIAEQKMLNKKIIIEMIHHKSHGLKSRMLQWEYANIVVLALLTVVCASMWTQTINTEVASFFVVFFVVIVISLVFGLYKIRLLSYIDFGKDTVTSSFKKTESFRLLITKERIAGLIFFPFLLLCAYVVVNFWVHHENIFSRPEVYVPRILIALAVGTAATIYVYKKVYFESLQKLKESLNEAKSFEDE